MFYQVKENINEFALHVQSLLKCELYLNRLQENIYEFQTFNS